VFWRLLFMLNYDVCPRVVFIVLSEVKRTDLHLLLTWEFSLIVINVWIEDLGMHKEFARSMGGGPESVFYKRLLSIATSELNVIPSGGMDGRGKGLGGLGMYFPGICARSMRMFVACVEGGVGLDDGREGRSAREYVKWEGTLGRILQRIGVVDDVCSLGAADCLAEISRCLY
jgi:hypothetical protein